MRKKIRSRTLSALLATVMALSCVGPAFAVEGTTAGADTTSSAPLTRSQFVALLYKGAGEPTVTAATAPFTDTAVDDAAIVWASQNAIISGNGTGAFLPDATITREQASVMLKGFCTTLGHGPVGSWATRISYDDLDAIAPWASGGAMWNGISKLIPVGEDNLFRPAATITPAEGQAMADAAVARK